jgi:hypothetical protein
MMRLVLEFDDDAHAHILAERLNRGRDFYISWKAHDSEKGLGIVGPDGLLIGGIDNRPRLIAATKCEGGSE